MNSERGRPTDARRPTTNDPAASQPTPVGEWTSADEHMRAAYGWLEAAESVARGGEGDLAGLVTLAWLRLELARYERGGTEAALDELVGVLRTVGRWSR